VRRFARAGRRPDERCLPNAQRRAGPTARGAVQVAALMALDRPPEAALLAQVVRQLQQLRAHLEQEEARFADSESHVLACSATPWVQLAQLTATVNTLPAALDEVEVRRRIGWRTLGRDHSAADIAESGPSGHATRRRARFKSFRPPTMVRDGGSAPLWWWRDVPTDASRMHAHFFWVTVRRTRPGPHRGRAHGAAAAPHRLAVAHSGREQPAGASLTHARFEAKHHGMADGGPARPWPPCLSVVLQAALQKETGRADEKLKLARKALMRNAQTLMVRHTRPRRAGPRRAGLAAQMADLSMGAAYGRVHGVAGAGAGARIADAVPSAMGSRQ